MKINENMISMEKLAAMEFETFVETSSFLVNRYIREYV